MCRLLQCHALASGAVVAGRGFNVWIYAVQVQPAKAEDSKAAIKTAVKDLIKSIPTDADKVFAWPMRWDAYDANAAALAPKISLWVKKKTTELLGEEELSMVEYVMNMVSKCSGGSNY